MTMTWILVANASQAQLYTLPKAQLLNDRSEPKIVDMFQHPESRQKGADFVSDRFGRHMSKGSGYGTYVAAHTPKSLEAEQFARELADVLAERLCNGRRSDDEEPQDLIIAAPPHFHGLLNKHLQSKHVDALVSLDIDKDYTGFRPRQLIQRLQAYLQ